MAALAGLSADQVFSVVFDSGLNRRCELGEVSDREFYDEFCRATGASLSNRIFARRQQHLHAERFVNPSAGAP